MKPFIYLASKSKRRRELLRGAKIPFRVVSSRFKEQTIEGNPVLTVMTNALGKAAFVKIKHPSGIVLGADTVVCLKNKIFGKPKHKIDAQRMLGQLSNTEHSVFTGVALFDYKTKIWKNFCVESKVKMKKFTKKDIKKYLSKVHSLDKAGAYAIQEHGDELIQKIKGSYSNVVGLPMEKLTETLHKIRDRSK